MLSLLPILFVLSAPEWRTYEVYAPEIERCFVVDPTAQELKYNHVSSIVWFKGEWFCAWNGNTIPAEGKPGQLNYLSRSTDGRDWSPPVAAFADESFSHNPVPCPKGCQWQPNLIVMEDELWALWDHYSKDDYAGCYFSRLDEPSGKWRNRRLLWKDTVTADEGSPKATLDGKPFRMFPTQNACVLGSGRILQPVTLMGPKAADAPGALDNWWVYEKRSSVIYSDDNGVTWRVSPGAVLPGKTWAQWEPCVWEQPDGSVMMFARYNDPRTAEEGGPPPSQCLLWSRSTDQGATWSPHAPVPIETVVSRPYVLPLEGGRFLMAHSDWHAGRFCSDRMNLALFSGRGNGFDFVAGPGFTGHEPIVAYPQMFVRDGALLVSYTQGTALRGIKVARITPLPAPDRYYLFPRTNRPSKGAPLEKNDVLLFDGREYLETNAPVDLSGEPFTLAASVRTTERGVLLDTRGAGKGFVWGLASNDVGGGGVVPFIHMGTAEGNIRSGLTVPFGEWTYCGLTVDPKAGSVTFVVNGQSEVLHIAPISKPLSGDTGYVGFKRFESSALTGFVGRMKALALFEGISFQPEDHASFARALAQSDAECPAAGSHSPLVWLTAHGPLDEQPFTAEDASPSARVAVSAEGTPFLEIVGDASAGVDLDPNDRQQGDIVEFAFRAQIAEGSEGVLCTVGDGDHPARVVVRDAVVRLESGGESIELAPRSEGDVPVWVRSGNGLTAARIGDGAQKEVSHAPQATWVYLGDGYPAGEGDSASRIRIDIASVRSRVVR